MGAYSDRVMADGASNYWRLGETSGVTAVDAVGGKNGDITGAVTLGAAGPFADGNKAMTFAGVDGSVQPGSISLLAPFSIEAWVKSSVTDKPFISNGTPTGFHIGAQGGKTWVYLTTSTSNVGVATIIDNAWHHIVVLLLPTRVEIYVDGRIDYVGAAVYVGSTAPLFIGMGGYHGQYWNGGIDDVALYPRALSASEIAKHVELSTVPLARDLTTLINPYLATLTGDMTARWKQMEKNAGF